MKQHPHKKLYVALITALCAAPFAAQASDTYKIYGKARMSVDMTDHGGNNLTSISSNSSRFGFKGVEDLGNGLKAIFQMETLVSMDNGTGDTIGTGGIGTTAGAGILFGTARDSYLGLAGGFGTLVLGVVSNPYRLATGKLDVSSDSMGDFNAIIGSISTTRTPFNEGEPNSINYWSPKMNGFQFMAAYRPDEDGAVKRDRYSTSATYESGPYYASVAYEKHDDDRTDGALNDTDGLKFGLSYLINHDKTKLGLVYEALSEDNIASAFDRNAWYLALSHKMDSNTFKIAYAQADDNDVASNTGADWFMVGLDHSLSKRTTVYALYAAANNDSGAKYGLGTGGSSGAAKPNTGKDPSTFSIGINHDF